ncbi:MAG: DUF1838 family protein [Chitinophagaceae bacterium]
MNTYLIRLQTLFVFLSCLQLGNAQPLNLEKPADNLAAYIKLRASLNPVEQPVFYAKGAIYAYTPEKPWQHLFNFEMYNIARVEKMNGDSGYRLITREMLVYEDPETDSILTEWQNPFTKEKVTVLHVWNDPVNQRFFNTSFYVPYDDNGNGRICMYNDVTLSYPSPLPKKDWPANSRSDVYQGAELFNFFCDKNRLLKKKTENIPADISWSRFSDFLPWMRMSSLPGNLLYQSRGYKMKSWNELPKKIKDFVLANHPEYATAPTSFETPNVTSWKYFKKVMLEKK